MACRQQASSIEWKGGESSPGKIEYVPH